MEPVLREDIRKYQYRVFTVFCIVNIDDNNGSEKKLSQRDVFCRLCQRLNLLWLGGFVQMSRQKMCEIATDLLDW